jgi:predicted metal-binding membrane protein
MLVMFGIGAGGLGWMAGLACVMVGETIAPDCKRIVRATGVALLLLGGLWLLHPAWLVPATVS